MAAANIRGFDMPARRPFFETLVQLIIGLLFMMIRRAFIRPAKLSYSRPDRAPGDPQYDRRVYEVGDWVFVGTLLIIALTGFLLEGVRIAMSDPGYGGTQFGGWIVAQALTGIRQSTLGGLRHGIWWFHGLLAITFVALAIVLLLSWQRFDRGQSSRNYRASGRDLQARLTRAA